MSMDKDQGWPDKIGPYEVEGILGRGGFGVVYRARDTQLGRRVAIKALLDPGAQFAEFRREAEILAEFSHVNIVQVHSIFEWHGSPMIVMEFVVGVPLSQWIRQHPAPDFLQRILLMEQLAEGMGHAHQKGVQHRDLKPQNIMVSPEGQVKVLDFGIARRRRADGQDSVTSALMGTISYMAPEQLNIGKTGFSSDVFAFGVIAYELLSDRHPFPGETDFLVQLAIVQSRPASLANIVPGLPVALLPVLNRCLEKDPALRYSDMGEVRRQLHRSIGPLKQREAQRFAEQSMAALTAGDRVEAQRLAGLAERLDPACLRLHEVQAKLEAPLRILSGAEEAILQALLGQVRNLLTTGKPEDQAAARGIVATLGKQFGWRSEFQVIGGASPVPVPKQGKSPPVRLVVRSRWLAAAGLILVLSVGATYWFLVDRTRKGASGPAGQKQTDSPSLVASPSPPKPSLTEAKLPVLPQAGELRTNPKDGLRYVYVPAGSFRMGCATDADGPCEDAEKPAHVVRISDGFWMGQTEVTVEAYKRHVRGVGKSMPSLETNGDSHPMTEVDWNDARRYCGWAGLRLPSEGEWEYAARGGTTGSRYGPDGDITWAWYRRNAGGEAMPVGQKTANGFKLYDMLGNVWEWTADWYGNYRDDSPERNPSGPKGGDSRVLRGGSWYSIESAVRASVRYAGPPADHDNTIGFRCAGDLPVP